MPLHATAVVKRSATVLSRASLDRLLALPWLACLFPYKRRHDRLDEAYRNRTARPYWPTAGLVARTGGGGLGFFATRIVCVVGTSGRTTNYAGSIVRGRAMGFVDTMASSIVRGAGGGGFSLSITTGVVGQTGGGTMGLTPTIVSSAAGASRTIVSSVCRADGGALAKIIMLATIMVSAVARLSGETLGFAPTIGSSAVCRVGCTCFTLTSVSVVVRRRSNRTLGVASTMVRAVCRRSRGSWRLLGIAWRIVDC